MTENIGSKNKVVILGGGNFGTTIANLVAENNLGAMLWVRNPEVAKEIQLTRENTRYLPGHRLHDNVTVSHDLNLVVENCSIVFLAIPSVSFRSVAKLISPHIPQGTIVVSTTKGIERESFKFMSQILKEEIPHADIAVMSGPNLAREIADRQLTATVIASDKPSVNEAVQKVLATRYFRVYSNSDVFGVELGGALKNIYGIMAGMGAALGVGSNTLSMLITRSLAEMGRFAKSLGADPSTFLGLAGVGDLITTCMSPYSRNYQIGFQIGNGKSLDDAIAHLGQVAEGVNTLKVVKQKADELGVYMPLANGLHDVLFANAPLDAVVSGLMSGDQASDVEFTLQPNN